MEQKKFKVVGATRYGSELADFINEKLEGSETKRECFEIALKEIGEDAEKHGLEIIEARD